MLEKYDLPEVFSVVYNTLLEFTVSLAIINVRQSYQTVYQIWRKNSANNAACKNFYVRGAHRRLYETWRAGSLKYGK